MASVMAPPKDLYNADSSRAGSSQQQLDSEQEQLRTRTAEQKAHPRLASAKPLAELGRAVHEPSHLHW